MYLAPPHKP